MFGSFDFLFLVTFGDKVTKMLRNICLHYARQDGQDRNNQKENYLSKVTKNQMTKIWDEQNIGVFLAGFGQKSSVWCMHVALPKLPIK